MKILRLEIKRCGECPYARVATPRAYCEKARPVRKKFGVTLSGKPPSWCPLPEAEAFKPTAIPGEAVERAADPSAGKKYRPGDIIRYGQKDGRQDALEVGYHVVPVAL